MWGVRFCNNALSCSDDVDREFIYSDFENNSKDRRETSWKQSHWNWGVYMYHVLFQPITCFCLLRSTSFAFHFSLLFTKRVWFQYSGGQATEGQGGYYGSGGASKIANPGEHTQQMQMLALAAVVQKITAAKGEVATLESLLESENKASNGEVTG